jgi:hypothetical protein
VFGPEPSDIGGLADDLGRSQVPASADLDELGGESGGEYASFLRVHDEALDERSWPYPRLAATATGGDDQLEAIVPEGDQPAQPGDEAEGAVRSDLG